MLIENAKVIHKYYELTKKELLVEIKNRDWFNEYETHRKIGSAYSNPSRSFLLTRLITEEAKNQLSTIYLSGYGIKRIGKHLNLTYTNTRHLLSNICGIELRKGMNVVTDKLREFRKNKALTESLDKSGWSKPEVRLELKIKNKTSKGVQGWYFNNSLNKYVWLRSTYEYIYAKWLDRTGHIWDTEVTTFTLSSGETYRPDFFVYDNSELVKIIEIKGYFDIRKNKAESLNLQLPNISVILLNFTNTSIDSYSEHGYHVELKKWKKEKHYYENQKNNS